MRRSKLDKLVLEYMIRDRLKSRSPREIASDTFFVPDTNALRVQKSCERLWRGGFLDRKRHVNPLRSRYKIAPSMFESIARIVQE